MTAEVVARLSSVRRRDFRRMVALSVLAHLALAVLLLSVPLGLRMTSPRVITVDLVALPAPGRQPAPAPRAAPAPAPPRPKQVVLPKKPSGASSKSVSKPKPAPEPKRRPSRPRPEQKSLEELMADMRAQAGEAPPAAPPEVAVAPAPSAGAGQRVSAEELAWRRRAKIHVRQAWIVPPGFRTQALETHVAVELDAAGNVLGEPRILQRSGNPWYDEGVVRGIAKASPLPAPPEPGEWQFVFVPEDSY